MQSNIHFSFISEFSIFLGTMILRNCLTLFILYPGWNNSQPVYRRLTFFARSQLYTCDLSENLFFCLTIK